MSTTDGDNTITRQPSSPNGPLTAPVVVVDDDHASQDVEAAQKELDDKVLLGKRSCMESIVLCFANLIPPLGVALSTHDCSRVTVAMLLTCCLYVPGLIYAFACSSKRGTGVRGFPLSIGFEEKYSNDDDDPRLQRWADSPCTLGL